MQEKVEILYLNIKAKTPLDLYFETSIRNIEEHFMEAFVYAGYTEIDLENMNKEIEDIKTWEPLERINFIADIALRCECLEEFKKKMK